jgi:hypothetical protein
MPFRNPDICVANSFTKLLKKLNPHKTPGPDNITHGVLKELATHISGFRKGISCDTQLVEFVDDVIRNLDSGKETDCLMYGI